MINAFKDPAATQASGLRLAGQKYFCLRVTDRSIYLKWQVSFLSPFPLNLLRRVDGPPGPTTGITAPEEKLI